MDLFIQKTTDILDYPVELSVWNVPGDIITGATSTSTPDGLTTTVTQDTTTTPKVWVSGGVAGVAYQVDLTISTLGGRTETFDLFQVTITNP